MELQELLYLINDNCIVDIYDAETSDIIATYDGKDSIDEDFNHYEITDIFTDNNRICIEIIRG